MVYHVILDVDNGGLDINNIVIPHNLLDGFSCDDGLSRQTP